MNIVVIDDASVGAYDIDAVDTDACVDVSANVSETITVVTSASVDAPVSAIELEIIDASDSVDAVVALNGVEVIVVVFCVLKEGVDVVVALDGVGVIVVVSCVLKKGVDVVDAISTVLILFSDVSGVRITKPNIKPRATAIRAKKVIATQIRIHSWRCKKLCCSVLVSRYTCLLSSILYQMKNSMLILRKMNTC